MTTTPLAVLDLVPVSSGSTAAGTYRSSEGAEAHVVPGYRAAFKPSAALARPYVSVSADVVVADTEAGARELIVTTITHDHSDRVRSHWLLAEAWARR